ncbi:membrane protein [Mycobacteroides abscessus subsp. abscessus]|nr:membrane protein [Mycobacteroides abscessus subsp. abscessus]SIN59379.1 membrane protein [Mycobacteroides abscessus subsp. abscessus]
MQAAVKAYFSTNPETENDLRAIRQPVVDFRERCQLPQERQP